MGKKANQKTTKRVDVWCPLCDERFQIQRIKSHANKHHTDKTVADLETAIRNGMENGSLRYEVTLFDGLSKTFSGTQAVKQNRVARGEKVSIVPGGAIEMGKRR